MAWDKPMPARPVVAVAGATGAVGVEMLKCLEALDFPTSEVRVLASARSAGQKLPFRGGELTVEEMTPESFEGVDIALFSAGASVSKAMREAVTKAGAVMIDNSSAFRMDPDVPLVVPEVNAADLAWHNGVIANPNCTTIQMVVALEPLRKLGHIDRIVVSSYQSSSGAGAKGMAELQEQTGAVLAGEDFEPKAFAHQIAFNCIPHIDVFMDDGYTKEEWKMVVETKKIMGAPTRSPLTASPISTSLWTTATPKKSGRWSSRPRRSWATTPCRWLPPACACPCCAATPRASTLSSTAP